MNNYIVTISFVLTLLFLEGFVPFKKNYKHRYRHIFRNSTLAITNAVITGLSSAVLGASLFLWAENNSIGLLRSMNLSPGIKLICTILFFDVWVYFWHRANHEILFFWKFHRVHHNDPQMDMTTAFRFHPIEIIISTALNMIIIIFFGINLQYLVIYKAIFHANVLIHHSNIALPDSLDAFLRLAIITPNMHKVHHSTERKQTDSNFASFLSFWDRIFMTFREDDPSVIEFGLKEFNEDKHQTSIGMLQLPFVKR